jgi:hypothetical protein
MVISAIFGLIGGIVAGHTGAYGDGEVVTTTTCSTRGIKSL